MRKHFAVAKENGATGEELQEAIAYGMMAPGGRAKNFAKTMLEELELPGDEQSS
jgi:alkylhydroperoxidase/carboxymuconolactone decarboxylase family protein YurZ